MPRQKQVSSPKILKLLTSIDIHSSVAVYVQIENHVQFAISAGALKPGDRLPSVHELSERLDVNPNTVAKSYRDLEVLGLLYSRRGMGIYINKGIEAKCRETCRRRIIGRLNEVLAEAKASNFKNKDVLAVVEKCLSVNCTPYEKTPAAVMRMAKLFSRGE